MRIHGSSFIDSISEVFEMTMVMAVQAVYLARVANYNEAKNSKLEGPESIAFTKSENRKQALSEANIVYAIS